MVQNQPISSPGLLLDQALDQLAGADRGDRFLRGRRSRCSKSAIARLVALERLAVGAELGIGVGHGDAAPRARPSRRVAARPARATAPARASGPSARRRPSRSRAAPCSPAGSCRRTRSRYVARGLRAGLARARRSRARRWPGRAGCGTPRAGIPCRASSSTVVPRAVSPADQRDAEVVARVARPAPASRHRGQRLGGAGVVAARHQHVRLQQAALFLAAPAGRRCSTRRERLFGLGQVAALVADLGEEVPGAVAHRRRGAARRAGANISPAWRVQAVRSSMPPRRISASSAWCGTRSKCCDTFSSVIAVK